MRTNIEIDDALLDQAMRATGLLTKRAMVEERLLVQVHQQAVALEDLKRLGRPGYLDEMRQHRPSRRPPLQS